MTQDEFASFIAEFYADLLSRQEPLGAEFERAWAENVEELYEE